MIPPFLQKWVFLNALRLLTIISAALVFSSTCLILQRDFKNVKSNQDSSDDVPSEDSDYLPGTDIPTHTWGPLWASMHHIYNLLILFLIFLSEISWGGILDRFFNAVLPFLGPDWGTGLMGGLMMILGADTLSRSIGHFPLISNWLMISVGLINVLSGIVFRARGKLLRSPKGFKAPVAEKLELLAEAKAKAEKVADILIPLPVTAKTTSPSSATETATRNMAPTPSSNAAGKVLGLIARARNGSKEPAKSSMAEHCHVVDDDKTMTDPDEGGLRKNQENKVENGSQMNGFRFPTGNPLPAAVPFNRASPAPPASISSSTATFVEGRNQLSPPRQPDLAHFVALHERGKLSHPERVDDHSPIRDLTWRSARTVASDKRSNTIGTLRSEDGTCNPKPVKTFHRGKERRAKVSDLTAEKMHSSRGGGDRFVDSDCSYRRSCSSSRNSGLSSPTSPCALVLEGSSEAERSPGLVASWRAAALEARIKAKSKSGRKRLYLGSNDWKMKRLESDSVSGGDRRGDVLSDGFDNEDDEGGLLPPYDPSGSRKNSIRERSRDRKGKSRERSNVEQSESGRTLSWGGTRLALGRNEGWALGTTLPRGGSRLRKNSNGIERNDICFDSSRTGHFGKVNGGGKWEASRDDRRRETRKDRTSLHTDTSEITYYSGGEEEIEEEEEDEEDMIARLDSYARSETGRHHRKAVVRRSRSCSYLMGGGGVRGGRVPSMKRSGSLCDEVGSTRRRGVGHHPTFRDQEEREEEEWLDDQDSHPIRDRNQRSQLSRKASGASSRSNSLRPRIIGDDQGARSRRESIELGERRRKGRHRVLASDAGVILFDGTSF